jgi:MSHA biogenesis protein MshO
MVIVIMGVIGGMVSVFMKSPIDAYFDSARRAALTDVADTVVRRIARDVRRALPNSLRPPAAGSQCIEFIPTKTGGRYRAAEIATADDTSLNFTVADSTFNIMGSNTSFAGNTIPTDQQIESGDFIVVYNLGIPDSDAYQTTGNLNRATVAPGASSIDETVTPGETKIVITPSTQFPLESGGSRFHVVDKDERSVSYVCVGCTTGVNAAGDGNGVLYRYVRPFSANHSCPQTAGDVATMVADPAVAVLAKNVSNAGFTYSGSDLQRNATVQINLSLTQSNETVSLYHEVHADNTP